MKILVTGGGGFLGGALSIKLIEQGYSVRSFSRGDYPELRKLGIDTKRGDITDTDAVIDTAKGCDVIFHAAAKAGVWGPYEEYYNTNVLGTENVLLACRKNNINRLVFTSTPSVVFHGTDQEGVNESEPYPEKYLAHYPETKAMAEKLVLDASSSDLATVSLRPHLIWGPKDPHLIPRIVERAKKGQLRLVGDGKNLVDSVYIDNAVLGHMLALKHLSTESPINGKVYFITNGEPLPIADLINKILNSAGLQPVTSKVSPGVAYAAGAAMEFAYSLTKRKDEPRMTRFVARELSCIHWFDISAAKQDLGYNPKVSIDEGMSRLKAWFQKKDQK